MRTTLILFGTLFLISNIIYGQVSNDICTSGIVLPVDGACHTYSNLGATDSANPTAGLNCGYGNAGYGDLWFLSIVPTSGNVTIETSQPAVGGIFEMDVEVYSGTCGSLSILSCSSHKERFNNYDYHARVELEGLAAGSIIYIRAIAPYGYTGDFDICVTDMGYNYPCRIDYIEVGTQSTCDPANNTYSQELTVYYRTDGSPNMMRIMDTSIMLTGSPQTVMVNNLPAHGSPVDVNAELHFNYDWNLCRAESSYYGDDLFIAPVNCYSNTVVNDDCSGAILLSVGAECTETIGDNTGASMSNTSNNNLGCYYTGSTLQDVWYKIEVPLSGDIVINTYSVNTSDVNPAFNIFEGSCGSLLGISTDCGNRWNSVRLTNQTPGDTLFIRVGDDSGYDQGEFGICVFEPEPFTNDICADAINIPVTSAINNMIFTSHQANVENNPTAIISCDQSGNPSEDVWFKVAAPPSGSVVLLTTEIERGNSDMVMEAFSGSCGSLVSIACDNNSSSDRHAKLELTGLASGSDVFVRISNYGNYHNTSFGFHAIQQSNDVCTSPINLPVDGACRTYSNIGATDSANPTDGLSCGYGNAGYGDLWFLSIVPASGNVTIETSQPTAGGLDRMDVEVYSGTCGSLSILSCSYEKERFNNYDPHARVELEGLAAGSIIYIRAIAPFGNTGDFDICVTDMGYNYPCKIDYIEVGTQSTCDPATNTYSQELIVYYRTDGSPNMMSIMDTTVMLTGSPQTVMVNNLPAHGSPVNVNAELHFNYDWNLCRAESRFYADDLFIAPVNCYSGTVVNDDCSGAILLSVGTACADYIGDNTGASLSTGVNRYFNCYYAGDSPQDVWYKFIVPASGDIVINTYQVFPYDVNAVFEVYEGTCGSLNLLQPTCGIYFNSIRLTGRISGESLYIRMADDGGNDQGEFGICVFEPEPFINDICADAIEIAVESECSPTPLIFSDHLASGESFPSANFSCGYSGSDLSRDVWFKIKTPTSGVVNLSTSEVERGYSRMQMEIFYGDCNNLVSMNCESSGINGHPEIIYLDPVISEYVFVRVSSYYPNESNSFSICATTECPDTEHIAADLVNTIHYEDHVSITANNMILPGADVIYDAGECIELQSGFQVDQGAQFEAVIGGCECPNVLTGTFSYYSSNHWCDLDAIESGSVVISSIGGNRYTFSDWSFGAYTTCYGGNGGNWGSLSFELINGEPVFNQLVDNYGDQWTIQSNYSNGLWQINWSNTYGEKGDAVINIPNCSWIDLFTNI